MPTHTLPPPVHLLLIEVAHAPRLPTTVADNVSINTQLTLSLLSYILPHIYFQTAPLFRFFMIAYLKVILFITYSGL